MNLIDSFEWRWYQVAAVWIASMTALALLIGIRLRRMPYTQWNVAFAPTPRGMLQLFFSLWRLSPVLALEVGCIPLVTLTLLVKYLLTLQN